MPGNLAKLVIPTGYEDEERKAQMRHQIAKALMEKGLGQQGPMQSWAQVLAQLGNAYFGKQEEKAATKLDTDVDSKIRDAYTGAISSLNSDVKGGMGLGDLVQKYGGNQFVQDALKPYADAFGSSLKEKENIVNTPTGFRRAGDVVGREKFDPNAMVIPDGHGGYAANPVRITAALAAQPNTQINNPQTTMQNPLSAGGPPAPSASPLPSATGGLDLSALTPEEKQILQSEIARRTGSAGQQAVTQLQNDTHVPMGSPLSAARAPAGAINGRPYWLINGVPYDNSEGK